MKRTCILFCFVLLLVGSVQSAPAQKDSVKTNWTKELIGSLNLSQASFDNWKQGGENSMAWQININGKLEHHGKQALWSNSGKFNFGKSKTGADETKTVIDEIKLESVLSYVVDSPVKPYAAMSFQTQSSAGYSYSDDEKTQISGFMDPGFLREAVGLNYILNDRFKTRIGASLKQTFADDFALLYSDDPETDNVEKRRDEFGAEWVTDCNWKLAQNLAYETKLEIFSAFEGVKETDVEWDNVLNAKISKYFNCTFNFKLFYDSQISIKRQIKQSLTMGVSYSFF